MLIPAAPATALGALRPLGGLALAGALSSSPALLGKNGGGGGSSPSAPLACFGFCALLSNARVIPSSHPVYDACWDLLLPLSLAMLVATTAARVGDEERGGGGGGGRAVLGAAFAAGSIGSVLGALAGFVSVTRGRWLWLRLPRDEAAKVTGALAASWVGGSFNLMEVSRHTKLSPATIGAMASADLLLMAVYFAAMLAGSKQELLHRPFLIRHSASKTTPAPAMALLTESSKGESIAQVKRQYQCERKSRTAAALAIGDTLLLSSISWAAGRAAERLISGIGTLTLTLFAFTLGRLGMRYFPKRYSRVTQVAPGVASVLVRLFFGAVGAGASLIEIMSAGPAILVFTGLGLSIHAIFTYLICSIMARTTNLSIGLDETIVASNACVGGPATAAAFAGLLNRSDLVLPAALWGTVGYALASGMGMSLADALIGA